jgi:hypothetical protein
VDDLHFGIKILIKKNPFLEKKNVPVPLPSKLFTNPIIPPLENLLTSNK